MMAAQMRGSMFNPMMMGNMNMGFPMPGTGMMPMSMPPAGIAEPPVDPAKFGAVDRWRRDVGGEAEG